MKTIATSIAAIGLTLSMTSPILAIDTTETSVTTRLSTADPIAASFLRDLHRAPSLTPRAVHVTSDQDPLPELFRIALGANSRPQLAPPALAWRH